MGNKGRSGDRWSYSAGHPPHTVRVYERKDSPNIYLATWDAEAGKEIKRSLKHSDRKKAKKLADELAPQLREGTTPTNEEAGDRSVSRILALYRKHRSPDKGEYSQKADKRHAKLWRNVLGANFHLPDLSRREWDRFLRRRRSGAIDAKGQLVPEKKQKEKGARTLEKDCRFLRAVCRWAMEWRDSDGDLLLERDPTRGLEIPKEKNPSRPVATHDRVDAIRAVYRDVTMRLERSGNRQEVESWLPEIFELVVGTGRRISAVCALRIENLELEETPRTPHGAICWPADTDKMGRKWRCPISERVRDAVEGALFKRRRQGLVGDGPLFPSAEDPSEPVTYYTARVWLEDAETEAELEPQEGGLWHPYRRLWASARKDLPNVDVARAGGWASLEALQRAYQRPDDATMLRVVQHDAELREVR